MRRSPRSAFAVRLQIIKSLVMRPAFDLCIQITESPIMRSAFALSLQIQNRRSCDQPLLFAYKLQNRRSCDHPSLSTYRLENHWILLNITTNTECSDQISRMHWWSSDFAVCITLTLFSGSGSVHELFRSLHTRVVQKVLSLIGFLSFIPSIF